MSYDDRDCPSSQGSYLEVLALGLFVLPSFIYLVLKWIGLRRFLALAVLVPQLSWRSLFVDPGLIDLALAFLLFGIVASWFFRHTED